MELRQINAASERQVFEERMTQARVVRNGGFTETRRSCIGKIHVQFGKMYALFQETGAPAEQMVGGFIAHDIASFAQSYRLPDFSKYPPESVFEVGEVWALAKGAGKMVLRAIPILLGLLQAQAAVGYAIVKPWDLTVFYKDLVPTGDPIEWPYARTLDGEKIFCRAMVTEGDHLRNWVDTNWANGFVTRDRHEKIWFPESAGGEISEPVQAPILHIAPPSDDSNGNGLAHA